MDHLFETSNQAAFLSLLVSGEQRRQVHLIFVCIHGLDGCVGYRDMDSTAYYPSDRYQVVFLVALKAS